MGATFKENCPDIRNSKVFDIYNGLKDFGVTPDVFDDNAVSSEIEHEYGVKPINKEDLHDFDCVIVAVSHNSFKSLDLDKMFKKNVSNSKKVIIDVKSVLDKQKYLDKGYRLWRL